MNDLENAYRQRYTDYLLPAAEELERFLNDCFSSTQRIDRICARAKSVSRFMGKAAKLQDGRQKYTHPLNEIQDQIGARIITYYNPDVEAVAKEVERYLHPIEDRLVVPDGDYEFGYVGKHFILMLPTDVSAALPVVEDAPQVFELQIKTLFQHAWAEAAHDLDYKPAVPLTPMQKRQVAFAAAQAWGADQILESLFRELGAKSEPAREAKQGTYLQSPGSVGGGDHAN